MRKTYLLIAIGSMSVILLIVLSLNMYDTAREGREVDRKFAEFADALSSGNITQAYSFCSPEFKSQTSLDEFIKLHKALAGNMGDLKQVNKTQTEVVQRKDSLEWVGRILADLHYSKGHVQILYEFHKNNGSWLMSGFEEFHDRNSKGSN